MSGTEQTIASAGRGPRRAGRALLLGLLAAGAPALAGTIDVNAGAAFSGTAGAEITLVETCISPDSRTVDSPPTIQGFFGACDDLTVQGVQVVGTGAVLQAGQSITLGDGFSTAPGAALTALVATPLSPFAYVTDETPAAVTTYSAAYRLDVDGLTIGASDSFASLMGESADGSEHFRVLISHHAGLGENRIRVVARQDDGTEVEGMQLQLPAGYNLIEVKWVAGAGTGSLVVAVNGSVFTGPTRLDNDQARIDRVRWGAIAGTVAASSGSLKQDDFSSGL